MIPKSLTKVEESNLFPIMIEKGLRKAVSDVSIEIDRYGKDNLEAFVLKGGDEEVVEQVECECCGLKEECTQEYIVKTKTCYTGKWVCGLCSEAVKERIKREQPAPPSRSITTAIEDALRCHKDFCQEFNTTTRLNPKLSLTFAMRKIAKRSCEGRNSTKISSIFSNLARSSSCGPRFNISLS